MLEVLMRSVSHVLISLFILGMAGSAIVVAITFSHDLFDFFEEDVKPASSGGSQQP